MIFWNLKSATHLQHSPSFPIATPTQNFFFRLALPLALTFRSGNREWHSMSGTLYNTLNLTIKEFREFRIICLSSASNFYSLLPNWDKSGIFARYISQPCNDTLHNNILNLRACRVRIMVCTWVQKKMIFRMNFEVTKIVGHENFFENPKLNIQKQTSFQPSVIVSLNRKSYVQENPLDVYYCT